jgi:hypothetical protein
MWFLENLYVDVPARRRGVATALLNYAEEFARSTGAERLALATAYDNLAAQMSIRRWATCAKSIFCISIVCCRECLRCKRMMLQLECSPDSGKSSTTSITSLSNSSFSGKGNGGFNLPISNPPPGEPRRFRGDVPWSPDLFSGHCRRGSTFG